VGGGGDREPVGGAGEVTLAVCVIKDNSETTARLLLQHYVDSVAREHGDLALAIVLTGSLVTGSYVPGPGDIDQITILTDDAPADAEGKIRAAVQAVMDGSGRVVNLADVTYRRHHLERPWSTEWNLRPETKHLATVPEELLRMHDHGQVIWGHLDIAQLPLPTWEETISYRTRWREWNRQSQEGNEEVAATMRDPSVRIAVQALLSNAIWHYYYATGLTCFSKHRIAGALQSEVPGYAFQSAVNLATALRRRGFDASAGEQESLVRSARELRQWNREHPVGAVPGRDE
jgi:hypothetical protein